MLVDVLFERSKFILGGGTSTRSSVVTCFDDFALWIRGFAEAWVIDQEAGSRNACHKNIVASIVNVQNNSILSIKL